MCSVWPLAPASQRTWRGSPGIWLYSISYSGAGEHPCAPGLRDDAWNALILMSKSSQCFLVWHLLKCIMEPHSLFSWDLGEVEFSVQATQRER